ncbi:thiol oxidoreductase [Amphritea japonica ATCC BAA-1530]|uniref:Thiol oxidoreductase n=1 Tax=Amphritea japonica ATCC BAA-1530 TaxID=1278309 RepID=A0A7R6SRP5_9GAMM|nr:thiol oxidoreductase [Amphritea japonica ATCC BAA-1530]
MLAEGMAIYNPGEELPGGDTSHHKPRNRDVFTHASANMRLANRLRFELGDSVFADIWLPSPSTSTASDGLGPLYNAHACEECHPRDGRGHPPTANWPNDRAVSMFLRLSIPPQTLEHHQLLKSGKVGVIPEPVYGGQLQNFSINGLSEEGHMHISYTEKTVNMADGTEIRLRKPEYTVSELNFGPLHPDVMLSPRVAPHMLGLLLLEAIPESDILSLSDPDDTDGDGISGRPNRVWDMFSEQQALGRFGWKAGNPTVIQQTVSALSNDIGIATPYMPSSSGDCTSAQITCLSQPNGNTPLQENTEASSIVVEQLVIYTGNLGPPARPDALKPEVLRGKRVFQRIGCHKCHQPSFQTAYRPDLAEQSAQLIWPYSDLLLHDMGEGLADHRPEYLASGREWRTPPLWGIGLTETVSGHSNFLHDGRARNLLEAILWHGGEAEASRQQVINLTSSERHALITFLNSL